MKTKLGTLKRIVAILLVLSLTCGVMPELSTAKNVYANENATQADNAATSTDAPKKIIDVDIQKSNCVVKEFYATYKVYVTIDITYLDFSKEQMVECITMKDDQLEWQTNDSYGNTIYISIDIGIRPEYSKDKTAYLYTEYTTYDMPKNRWDALCPLIVDVKYNAPKDKIVKKATCTEEGLKNVWDRKYKMYLGVSIPPLGHKYGKERWIIKPATTKANGYSKYGQLCERCGNIKAKKSRVIYAIGQAKVECDSYTYTGREIKPKVTVLTENGYVISPSNYTVKYYKNVDVGVALAKVVFTGKFYKGELTDRFVIEPAAPKLTVKNNLKGAKITWKPSKGADGYQIYAYRYTNDKTRTELIADIPAGKACEWTDIYVRKYPRDDMGYCIKAYVKVGKQKVGTKSEPKVWFWDDQKPSYFIKRALPSIMVIRMHTNQINAGYEVQISRNKQMKNSVTKIIQKKDMKNGTISIKRKFSAGAKYYVRIRSFEYVDGVKYYTVWGNKETINISKTVIPMQKVSQ